MREPGRPLPADDVRAILRRVQMGEDRGDIAARYGITRATISKYLRTNKHTGRRANRHRDDRWMQAAACVDPDTGLPLWGQIKTKRKAPKRYGYFTEWHVDQQAKICRGCPVSAECLGFGLQFHSGDCTWPTGEGPVYGGYTPPQMAKLKKGVAA